ncbi:MAG TPA: inositol monophosphatase family protein [Euzebyales bacterium]
MPPAEPHPLHDVVAALLRRVATEVVLVHFRSLSDHDVREKSPGDPVTVADEQAEAQLRAGLLQALPAARVVGEEAASADPSLLDGLGEGTVWVVDPIDGTSNFADGVSPFALMVALVDDGLTTAGWIYDPVAERLCHAHRGHGAFVDGRTVLARASGADPPRAMLATTFTSADERGDRAARAAGRFTEVPNPRCAGEQYPQVVLGETDVALFQRALPWDHAPGTLFVSEAGGRAARPDGTPYRVADRRPGLLIAATPLLWDSAATVLFD